MQLCDWGTKLIFIVKKRASFECMKIVLTEPLYRDNKRSAKLQKY